MKHARADYDCIQPWPTKRPHIAKQDGETIVVPFDGPGAESRVQPIIPDDEPVFLIRGQDLAAIPAALAWCKAADDLGADPTIIQAVERHIELVREWQRDHASRASPWPAPTWP